MITRTSEAKRSSNAANLALCSVPVVASTPTTPLRVAAAAGLTAVFLAVPMAYEVLKWAGALYLLWLAWQAVKPGARSPFEAQQLPPELAERYRAEGAEVLTVDRERIAQMGVELVERPLASPSGDFARHDPDALASAVLDIYRARAVHIYGGSESYRIEK